MQDNAENDGAGDGTGEHVINVQITGQYDYSKHDAGQAAWTKPADKQLTFGAIAAAAKRNKNRQHSYHCQA